LTYEESIKNEKSALGQQRLDGNTTHSLGKSSSWKATNRSTQRQRQHSATGNHSFVEQQHVLHFVYLGE
jgi:hypothetical protein